ncbi:MAG TPA: EamA family transporter [Solibacterales bacterium]|nr:EamA family transporter [Bryobacterales bacterium]
MKHARRWEAEAALLGNSLIWGTTFVLVKGALADVSPLLFLVLRFGLAAAILAAIYGGRFERASLAPGLFAGVFLFLGYFLQTAGLQFTTPSKSAFFTSLSIPLVPLLGALVYRTRPRRIEVIGVAVATAGMLLMTVQGLSLHFGTGDLLSVGCAVAFAGHIVTVGHYSGRSNFQTIAVMQIVVAAALAALTFWWAEPVRAHWNAGVLTAVAVTGVFATALAFSVQAWAQQYTAPTRTALIYTLEPVFAWGTSRILLGERLPWTTAAGAMLIVCGVLLVELKPSRADRHPTG